MLLKATPSKKALVKEGTYKTKVSSTTGKPNEDTPKKVVIGFKSDEFEAELFKEVPASLDDGMPLRGDAQTILGRVLSREEAEAGINIKDLIGKPCRVVVMHKTGIGGGKPKAVVSLVLPAETAPAPTV